MWLFQQPMRSASFCIPRAAQARPRGGALSASALAGGIQHDVHRHADDDRRRGLRELRGGATQEKALLNVPLFHATGLLGSFVLPLVTAQGIVMISKWDAQEALRLIEAERVTLSVVCRLWSRTY